MRRAVVLVVLAVALAGCARHAVPKAGVPAAPRPVPVLFTGPLPSYQPG